MSSENQGEPAINPPKPQSRGKAGATTIRISGKTLEILQKHGRFGETRDEVIQRLLKLSIGEDLDAVDQE